MACIRTIGILIIGVIIILIIIHCSKYTYKEHFSGASTTPNNSPQPRKQHKPNLSPRGPPIDCTNSMFPPPPSNIPPSAYAQLMSPLILTSENNPVTNPTMHLDSKGGYFYDFYSDKKICNTPSYIRASSNDTCAEYGIGEMAEGPPGYQFCVCEAKTRNDNTKLNKDKITKDNITANNISIGIGAVCTADSQCCSNHCASVPGQFSKMCLCPNGQRWSEYMNICVPVYHPNNGNWSSMYDNHVEVYRPPPVGSAITTGKLCASNKECSLGEYCTPDNFCASGIIPTTEKDGNYYTIGANCQTNDQCANNMICNEGTCSCESPLIFEWSSRTCQCANGALSLNDDKKCVKPSTITRQICPTKLPAFAKGWNDCGLGEKFNPSTNQCLCVSDLDTIHKGKVGQGGICRDNDDCALGYCKEISGISVCVEPQNIPIFDLATQYYSY